MGSGASSATPCLAGFFALRCFSLITIWVTPESWAVKLITSLPHWFYTRILRVPKCFPAVGPSLDANSLHNSGNKYQTLLEECESALAIWNRYGAEISESRLASKEAGDELLRLQAKYAWAYTVLQNHAHNCSFCRWVANLEGRDLENESQPLPASYR